ncbi:MAG: amidoligase family protein [Mangrovicoccus sp.]
MSLPDQPLTFPATARFDPERRIGVEVELGGLSEAAIAELLVDLFDGEVTGKAAHRWTVDLPDLGEMVIELDTSWSPEIAELGDWAGDIARQVVPVELITAPIREQDLARLQEILNQCLAAGAYGSESSVVSAFGVHFNPSLLDPAQELLPIARAYAVLEPWLRRHARLDLSRRVLPFIDPWPEDLVFALARPQAAEWSLDMFTEIYLTQIRSRNYGLDLLPLLRHLDRDRMAQLAPDLAEGGARPTYHFRLPQCRLSEPDWQIGQEWALWQAVETVAQSRELVDQLGSLHLQLDDPSEAIETALKPLTDRSEFACLA